MRPSAIRGVHPATLPTLVLLTCASIFAVLSATGAPAARQDAPEPRVIDVLAKRYAFEPSEIEVSEGERVRLVVRSADGLHGVEIKQFRVSMDIPRGGAPVVIEFTANVVGRFPILCSVYCGDEHEEMKGALVVTARPSAQP